MFKILVLQINSALNKQSQMPQHTCTIKISDCTLLTIQV